MHIPDGILSAEILAACGAASAAGIAWSAKKAEANTGANRIPLLGVLGAFVFAAQMVNFPVGPGASAHLLGGALLAATLGPWAASIVLTAILIVQALVFQDGGLLALAANVFNMTLIGVWAAWLPFRALRSMGHPRAGLFVGALLSVMLSAVFALGEVSVSSGVVTQGLWIFCLGMFFITGLIEATISVAAWEAIERLEGKHHVPFQLRKNLPYMLAACVAVMMTGVFFASNSPDVLEYFQQRTGVSAQTAAFPSVLPALLPDYEWKGLDAEWLRKSAAGAAGLLIVYAVSLLVSRWMHKPNEA